MCGDIHLRITITCPEVLFLMWLSIADQCPFFFETGQTKVIPDEAGNVVVLEQTGHLPPYFKRNRAAISLLTSAVPPPIVASFQSR